MSDEAQTPDPTWDGPTPPADAKPGLETSGATGEKAGSGAEPDAGRDPWARPAGDAVGPPTRDTWASPTRDAEAMPTVFGEDVPLAGECGDAVRGAGVGVGAGCPWGVGGGGL
ncbi:hypothetical protein B1R27_18935 [Streptomyces sp. GKU 895]|nr:hypothetical protein B1R27_18935 [Streptomyces sp. GKU 895]